ncbi:MAG: hypothetical protein AMS27_04630 [Bacteroides sp. SM23_62_1]|nr:MAG: hypothetical protein AMS27_04630 [Bacteroides sp. SM23_62_1]
MDNFIVSARKYRPDTFSSVVGQDSITATLKNTIVNKHLGHAYLFCGPRGVGKTTCARIFAKTINCSNITDQHEPCNQCESCISFNEMRAFNIHELDAASNNSVEDIRNLSDRVRIPPQIGKYSIYIIDEVHMLSTPAFNAFLKTLEEPPSHAVFILATTEKQKIIPTILSRCQIFDFNRIRVHDIVGYLEKIAKKEKVDFEPDALNIIALKADGAMRDALSIFDQMVSFSGQKITYKDVIQNLNILDYDYYFKITDAFLEGKINDSLLIFNEILNEGFDGHNFIVGLGGHFRDLLVCRDTETLVLLETGATISERYKEQSSRCDINFLYKSLEICSTTDIYYKASRNQKLHVELAMIKLCRITGVTEKKTLIETETKNESESAEGKMPSPEPERKDDLGDETAASVKKDQEEQDSKIPGVESDVSDDETSVKRIKKQIRDSEDSAREDQTIDGGESLEKVVDKQKTDDQKQGEPKSKKSTIYSSKYSIRDVLTGNNNQKVETEEITEFQEIEQDIHSEPFTSKELIQAWIDFAENIKETRPRMYNTLKGHLPELGNGNEIDLVLDNSAQQDDFQQDIKQDILLYLRKVLKNDLIVINTVVKTGVSNKTKLYTSEEKYEHMLKKNPGLGKLKQDFNLDFE